MTAPYIVAHRGDREHALENTLEAFSLAFEMPEVFAAECDVHLTRDNQLVIFHDNTLDRLFGESGRISDFSYAELEEKKFSNFEEGATLPLLSDVIHLAKQHKKKLLVEIKGDSKEAAHAIMTELIDFVEERDIDRDIMVISFWPEPIRLFKRIYQDIVTGLILGNGFEPSKLIELAKMAETDGICSASDYVSSELVEQAHEENLFINAWTVNDNLTFERMKECGVEYISTDYPGRFLVK
jgi:glycerophosphoryl diester phosphodiesterase